MKDPWRLVVESAKTDLANMGNGDPHHSSYPFRQLMFEVPSVKKEPEPVPAWRQGKLFRLLGMSGDHFMTDEFTFPGMTNAPLSYGIKWVGVKMDAGGMIPEEIEKVSMNWDRSKVGRRPHVLYMIPQVDVLVSKELNYPADPYYFLQHDTHVVRTCLRCSVSTLMAGFGKVIGPGMRLGWITSNSMFRDQLVAYTDSGFQHPHAFGQAYVCELLGKDGWQIDGFSR
ncbi:hypothetical protein BS17DRAFT_764191 [Gyrodon lividus]|nr:hypothetical protein BS17DRAFT_764191 [Gyrodon lividus]